jgi:hypothetical protein
MPKAKPRPTKGHWPLGKRRNKVADDWHQVRETLTQLVTVHLVATIRSQTALAEKLGVSQRSVGRWISGEDVPQSLYQSKLRTWCRQQLRRVSRNVS